MLNKLSTCLLALGILLGASGNAHAVLTETQVEDALEPCDTFLKGLEGSRITIGCLFSYTDLWRLAGRWEEFDELWDAKTIYAVAASKGYKSLPMSQLHAQALPQVELIGYGNFTAWNLAAGCVVTGGVPADVCKKP